MSSVYFKINHLNHFKLEFTLKNRESSKICLPHLNFVTHRDGFTIAIKNEYPQTSDIDLLESIQIQALPFLTSFS